MNNKLLENIFKNMDYDTYKKLDKTSHFSVLYGIVNPFVVGSITCPPLEIALTSYVVLSQIYYLYTNILNCEKYTKNVLELKELYNIVIDNVSGLINEFELKNPVEIYAFYNKILNNGYLSYNNSFFKGFCEIDDINNWYGVNVITGKGVCRHIASMLDDIYNKMNINACTTPVYFNENALLTEKLEELISDYKLIFNSVNDKEEKEIIKDMIAKYQKIIRKYKLKINPFEKLYGNHMINLASDNNFCYILDPTNEIIYRKKEDTPNILKNPIYSEITGNIYLSRTYDNPKQKERILLLPNSDINDNNILIDKANNLYNNNLDLIDRFSCENNELYGDINNKLVKIKKK